MWRDGPGPRDPHPRRRSRISEGGRRAAISSAWQGAGGSARCDPRIGVRRGGAARRLGGGDRRCGRRERGLGGARQDRRAADWLMVLLFAHATSRRTDPRQDLAGRQLGFHARGRGHGTTAHHELRQHVRDRGREILRPRFFRPARPRSARGQARSRRDQSGSAVSGVQRHRVPVAEGSDADRAGENRPSLARAAAREASEPVMPSAATGSSSRVGAARSGR